MINARCVIIPQMYINLRWNVFLNKYDHFPKHIIYRYLICLLSVRLYLKIKAKYIFFRDFSFEPLNHLMIVNCPRLLPRQFSQQFLVEDHTHAKDVMRRLLCRAFQNVENKWRLNSLIIANCPMLSYLQTFR